MSTGIIIIVFLSIVSDEALSNSTRKLKCALEKVFITSRTKKMGYFSENIVLRKKEKSIRQHKILYRDEHCHLKRK